MKKYDDSNEKANKPRVTLKSSKNRENSYKNSSRTSQISSKKSTPVKQSPRKNKVQHNIQELSLLIQDNSEKRVNLE